MNEIEILKHSLNISVWMLGVTLLLAVTTVTFGAINMGFQRSHNRKSVKPFCNIHKYISDAGLSIGIMNAGLGPMIILNIVFLKKSDDPVNRGLPLSSLVSGELHCDELINKSDSYIVPSMGEMKILQYTAGRTGKEADIELLKSTLEGFYLCVVFKDIYDHKYEKRELLKF